MPINTLIVDDEKPARDELAFLLKSFPDVHLVGQGKNGVEALALIKEHSPDLVFLDVQMPGLNGFGVIKKLMDRKGKLPQIVFATAFDNYAVQAFEVNAIDYVLKPIEKSRLARAIQRAKKALEAEASPSERLETLVSQIGAAKAPPVKLLVKTQQRLFLVDAEDVIFASIEDGTITVVAREVEGTSNYRTIEELQSHRSNPMFSGARTAPTWSTSTTSRKSCRGSSPATCSKWPISAGPKSRKPRADQAPPRIAEDVALVGQASACLVLTCLAVARIEQSNEDRLKPVLLC